MHRVQEFRCAKELIAPKDALTNAQVRNKRVICPSWNYLISSYKSRPTRTFHILQCMAVTVNCSRMYRCKFVALLPRSFRCVAPVDRACIICWRKIGCRCRFALARESQRERKSFRVLLCGDRNTASLNIECHSARKKCEWTFSHQQESEVYTVHTTFSASWSCKGS